MTDHSCHWCGEVVETRLIGVHSPRQGRFVFIGLICKYCYMQEQTPEQQRLHPWEYRPLPHKELKA